MTKLAKRRKFIKRLLGLAAVVAIAAPLGACGKKKAPDYPENATYPRIYPADPAK